MIFLDMLRLCTLILASILTSCVFEEGFSEACFVGDSITHMWDLDYYFPSLKIHKHAVSGAGVEDIDKWNLSNCKGVPTVFLMGTNNIGSISIKDADAKDQREAFVRALIPRLKRIEASPLMYTSILPRNYQWKQSPGVNKNIDLLNDIVHGILDEYSGENKPAFRNGGNRQTGIQETALAA